MKTKKRNSKTITLVETAMLCALAAVLMLVVRFSLLPNFAFLEYDMGDIPVALATLLLGSPAGFIVLTFVSLIQSLTVSAASSWEGFVMHMFATGAYIIILSLFMRKHDDIKHLTLGCITASIAMTAIMVPLNLIFTPMYLNIPVKGVLEIIVPAILPFNFIKGLINSLIIILIYKPLENILKKSNLLVHKEQKLNNKEDKEDKYA